MEHLAIPVGANDSNGKVELKASNMSEMESSFFNSPSSMNITMTNPLLIHEQVRLFDLASDEVTPLVIEVNSCLIHPFQTFRNLASPLIEDFRIGEVFLLVLAIADSNIKLTNDRGNLQNKDWETIRKYLA